ncbi:MAG: biotin/lipoate A/B protein ligase family protein [Lentisphaeria bacterium]|nr:biotin/lipoate A/B protein ligase family protein [Lentisphaeria bacterium]
MRIIWSEYRDPAANAAFEEQLYRADAVAGPILLFYRNDDAVLFGRNQNPWQECHVSWCRRHGITLLRRISGGGTVYHDSGNLNYALVLPRSDYHPERYLGMIADALRQAGLPEVSQSSHFSLWSGQRKVAGTAFALNSRAALLHGCILVRSDLERLRLALATPPGWECQGSGVASVRVPVTAMAEHLPGITTGDVARLIAGRVLDGQGPAEEEVIADGRLDGDDAFAAARERFRSDAWTFERTGDFTLKLPCPSGLLNLGITQGRIRRAVLHNSAGLTDLPALQGCPMTISEDRLLSLVHPM